MQDEVVIALLPAPCSPQHNGTSIIWTYGTYYKNRDLCTPGPSYQRKAQLSGSQHLRTISVSRLMFSERAGLADKSEREESGQQGNKQETRCDTVKLCYLIGSCFMVWYSLNVQTASRERRQPRAMPCGLVGNVRQRIKRTNWRENFCDYR